MPDERVLNFEKSRQDREVRELLEKLTKIGETMFQEFARYNLSIDDAGKFVRIVMPNMFQEKVNKVMAGLYVADVLKEAAGKTGLFTDKK